MRAIKKPVTVNNSEHIRTLKEEIETEVHKYDGAEGGWAEDLVHKIFNLIDEFLVYGNEVAE